MAEKYTDETYYAVKMRVDQRESLIREVRKISKEIARLTKLREETRTEARRLKSSAIAIDLGVSQSWVEKISECRVIR